MSTLKVNKLRDTAGSADAITLDPNGGAVLAGVTTVSTIKVGSGVTISSDGDVFHTGVCTATSFVGDAASLTKIPAANIVGVATGGFKKSGETSLQVLEQFMSPADGSSFVTSNGTVTLTDVTSILELTTSFQTLTGSQITYTPPTGTTLVIYECQFTLRSSDSNAILGGHLRIDSDTILESRFGLRGATNYSDHLYHFKFGINIGGSASATTGRVASWTSGKTLKLELNEHGSSYEFVANILGNYGSDGHQGVVRRPQIGITAIGTLS